MKAGVRDGGPQTLVFRALSFILNQSSLATALCNPYRLPSVVVHR